MLDNLGNRDEFDAARERQAPDIDGVTYINDGEAKIGDMVKVKITDSMDYDLIGGIV